MGSNVALGSAHKANAVGLVLVALLFVQVHDVHLLVQWKRNCGENSLGAALHVVEHLVSGNLLIVLVRSNNVDARSGGSRDQGQHVHCEEEMQHDVLLVQFREQGPSLEEFMLQQGVHMWRCLWWWWRRRGKDRRDKAGWSELTSTAVCLGKEV